MTVTPPLSEEDGTISAGDLTLTIAPDGTITGLMDPNDTDHRAPSESRALVSLIVEYSSTERASTGTTAHYNPVNVTYAAGIAETGESKRGQYNFYFPSGITVLVTAVEKPDYVTLEVTSITNSNDKDIRIVLWGPLTTTITENVGDKVGVVSNRDFAIGMMGVNSKTIGGWPMEYRDIGYANDAFRRCPC